MPFQIASWQAQLLQVVQVVLDDVGPPRKTAQDIIAQVTTTVFEDLPPGLNIVD